MYKIHANICIQKAKDAKAIRHIASFFFCDSDHKAISYVS